MPWNGNAPNKTFGRSDGTRTGTQVWQQAEADGVDIVSPDHDTHDQDLAAAINAALLKDGGNTASGNLPMGGFRHTGVGDALALTQYTSLSQSIKNGGLYVANVGGTGNAITLTTTYNVTAIATGQEYSFVVGANNTEPATVVIDGLAAVAIKRPDGSALEDGDLYAGAIAIIKNDGTQFQLINRRLTDGGGGGTGPTDAEIVTAINSELGGTGWQESATAAALPIEFTDIDARVTLIGQTNEYAGGGSGEFNVRVTADGRIIVTGDTGGLGLDAAGDNYGGFELDWDRVNNGTITAVYQATDYILIQTDQTVGNLWSVGLNATYGVLGHGDTTARKVPTRIAYFNTTNPVKIASVWTEAGTAIAADRFWFAIDTNGNLFSCGSGINYTQGGNSVSPVTTPRPVTQSDGTTQLTNIVEVSCCSVYGPVLARTTSGTLWRWGAGTSGAAGQGAATDITWPAILGGGTPTTGITKAVTTATNISATRAASAIIEGGVLKVAGDRNNGIGDGTTSGTPVTAFTTVAGSLASLTTTDVAAGDGEFPIFGAIDSYGDLWLAGYGTENIYGAGAATAANNTFANPTLPSTAASTVTITNASPAVVTWTGHRHKNGDRVHFTTSGALPSGLTANTTYYVVNADVSAGTFQVSATSGGAAINTGTAGSGTQTGKVHFSKVRIGGFNAMPVIYAEANGVIYTIGDDTYYQTAQNVAASTKATRTWQRMQGQLFTNSDWYATGPRVTYGMHMLCSNGHSRYCGYNAQGQGGVQPSNLHSVVNLQAMMPAGPRLLKPPTPRGGYNSGAEYSYQDFVVYNGSTYIFIAENAATGIVPTNTDYWATFVEGASASSVTASATFDTDTVGIIADGTAKAVKKGTFTNDSSGNVSPVTHDVGALGRVTRGWSDLWLANGAVISWTDGVSSSKTATEASGLLTWAGLFHKLAAGTTANAPLTLTSGTNLTTAAAGATEFDGTALYFTSVASSRQVVHASQISLLAADFTGTDVSTAQPVFSTSQDVLTVAASTTYRFRAHYWISRAAGTTSHTTAVLFGGTATLTNIEYIATVANPTGNALGNTQAIIGNAASAVTLTAANTSGTENLMITLEGTICVNGAGTLIPQFQFSAAPGGAPTIKRGSFIELRPIGTNTVAAIGNWA